jgi:hypothetical protein
MAFYRRLQMTIFRFVRYSKVNQASEGGFSAPELGGDRGGEMGC